MLYRAATTATVAIIFNIALSAQSAAGSDSSQPATGLENRHFIVNRNKVLVFSTKTVAVGPYSSTLALNDDPIRWSKPVLAPAGTKQISVHVTTTGVAVPTGAWEIRFKDLRGVQKDVVSADSPRAREGEFWSDDVPGNGVLVEVWANQVPTGLVVTIDRYSILSVPSVPQAIYGEDQRMSIIKAPPEIKKRGVPVARLRIKDARGEARCTGFLITDDLILTNFHCVSRNSQAVGTSADFGYDSPNATCKTFRGAKLELVNSDEGLDYALIRLMGKPGIEFGHVQLRDTGLAVLDIGHKLLLIEHAAGQAKQASITDCDVSARRIAGVNLKLLSDFGHHCDTLGGSSGSPVFDLASGELLGLHHLGFDDRQSMSLAKSARTYSFENQAIYIGYIVQDIREQSRSLFQEIISGSQ